MIVQFESVTHKNKFSSPLQILDNRFLHDRKVTAPLELSQSNIQAKEMIIVLKRAKAMAGNLSFFADNSTDIVERSIGDNFGSNKEQYFRIKKKENADYMFWSITADTGIIILDYIGVITLDDNYEASAERPWLTLPRFTVEPKFGYESIGDDIRGFIGQPYGRTIRQLKTLSVNFEGVKTEVIDKYYNEVGLTEPHWIVPYPEAVNEFPPLWAILSGPPEFTKRSENGWYWNCSLSWKEAY